MIITYDEQNFYIELNDGSKPVFWSRNELEEHFIEKYVNSFVYVNALHKGKGKKEQFLYKEDYEVCGFNYRKFVYLLEKGEIKVDLRIGQHHKGKNKGKIHDHGTAFRIDISKQKTLFKQIDKGEQND